MNKAYNRINWENYPSEKTPVNDENLNKLDYATDEIDNRIISLDTTKATKTEVATMIADVSFDETTGIFTFTRKNGATFTVDTILEKIIINFDFDRDAQKLIITMEDGSKKEIDLSVFITQYEFVDSDTIAFTVDNAGKVVAIVKEGSIQGKHLRPDYLADIKVESAKAEASATAAKTSEENAKSWEEKAEKVAEDFEKNGVSGVKGDAETTYRKGDVNITKANIGLGNVPNVSTNDQTPTFSQAASRANIASGEKISTIFGKIAKWYADLKTVAFSGSYSDLSDKPTIPTRTSQLTNDSGFNDKTYDVATTTKDGLVPKTPAPDSNQTYILEPGSGGVVWHKLTEWSYLETDNYTVQGYINFDPTIGCSTWFIEDATPGGTFEGNTIKMFFDRTEFSKPIYEQGVSLSDKYMKKGSVTQIGKTSENYSGFFTFDYLDVDGYATILVSDKSTDNSIDIYTTKTEFGKEIVAPNFSGKINGYTVNADVPSNAKFTDTNTWRGIQDNLTSSTNTTESLSAKQGYLLANGSARDNTKLPLSGGTMTGNIILGTNSTIKSGSNQSLGVAYGTKTSDGVTSQSGLIVGDITASGNGAYLILGNDCFATKYIKPLADKKNNLGDSSHRWSGVYAGTFYEDGKSLTEIYSEKSKILTTVEACTASTDATNVPNAAVISALNSSLTNKVSFAKVATVYQNETTSVTKDEFKMGNANALLVTCKWAAGFYTSQVMLPSIAYHFVFDNNASMYTALVVWNNSTGTVACTNRTNVYIYAVSVIS